MHRIVPVLLLAYLCCGCYGKPHNRNGHHGKNKRNDENEPGLDDFPGRKSIVHDPSEQLERLRMNLARQTRHGHHKVDPCFYKRCGLGEECVVTSSAAQCVCKKRCKPTNKPLCGSDGEYYESPCEMHRSGCIYEKHNLYDARHKDCFYKASDCSTNNMKEYKSLLMDYYRNMVTESDRYEITEGEEIGRDMSRDHTKKRDRMNSNEQNSTTQLETIETIDSNSIQVSLQEDEMYYDYQGELEENGLNEADSNDPQEELAEEENSEILTSDLDGELVKYMFNFYDLDEDGLIGSEEINQVIKLQQLDDVLPGPCSLHHLLYYGDRDENKGVDIEEMFDLFNITVLKLPRDQRLMLVDGVVEQPMQIECGIQGDNTPVWKRYGHDIDESNDYRISGNSLHLTELTMKKAGNFTCSAHKRPELVQTISVKVLMPPEVKVFPPMQHVHIGTSATIVCVAKGIPTPKLTWLKNGEPINPNSERYLLMGEENELHFNDVQLEDDATYSCSAQNEAGTREDSASLRVQRILTTEDESSLDFYTIFHADGISFVKPESCGVLHHISPDQDLPGLLRENTICGANDSGQLSCLWSSSVSTNTGTVYAAQPDQDRIIVINQSTERIEEVITTDVMPVKLIYISSMDQIFVLCWIDQTQNHYTLQVISKAGVKGKHYAEHVRPILNNGKYDYDISIKDLFFPSEGAMNRLTRKGYATHPNEQMIYILDIMTLKYVDYIDLSAYQCTPTQVLYQPIGGLLRVICTNEVTSHFLVISEENNEIIEFEEGVNIDKEYFSDDFSYLVRIYTKLEKITICKVESNGVIKQEMTIRTNFEVADVSFAYKEYSPTSSILYLVSREEGNLMYVDLTKKKVQLLNERQGEVTEQLLPWQHTARKLTHSGWYGRFMLSSGNDVVEVITLNGNQIMCRIDDVMHATTIQWYSPMK